MNKYIFSAAVAALLIVPFGVNALPLKDGMNSESAWQIAQNNFTGEKRMGKGRGIERLLDQLDLTSEQSEKIAAIQEDFRSQNESLHEEMQANRQEMRSLFSNDASAEELRQQHQEMQSLHEQLGNNRFETMLQIREILTPEQRDQMAELMEQHQGRGKGRYGDL
jgi:Spy/CpxP family protein refolding chaperone